MIQILVDGRLALTTAQAAELYELTPAAMRKELSRQRVEAVDHLDGRTPLYDALGLDRILLNRPGPGRPRGEGGPGAS